MKKLFSTLLLAAVAMATVSCEEVVDAVTDLINPGDEFTYTGNTEVSSNGFTIYTQEGSTFVVTQGSNEIDIEMTQIKFNENMPAMDITISDIPATDGAFSISEVIPTLAGVPMEDYAISEVSGTYDESSLSIDFICLTLNVSFNGSVE